MLLLSLPLGLLPAGATAQSGSDGHDGSWNGERALELVRRARELRHGTATDSAFRSYAADARGFVYFFLDRPASEERTLVKTDQVALEVFWRSPDLARQRIVGLRDEKELPTSIRYHLDHLTVVQDDFADRIRLGDGDEVEAVRHPVARGAETTYDYRLVDSLTIRFQGGRDPVRVYELQVRPKDLEAPGVVGSVFLDRASAAIVRMNFTFTPSAYVDPYLDYIRISLDNSLWEGRYWLPYRQSVEIRRELPQLDFPAGSVIRGRYEIGNYRFNVDLPPGLFRGGQVIAVPEAQRRAFPFEEDLHARIDAEGLTPAPELEEIRREAVRLAGRRALSGLRPLRLFAPSASSVLRYDRAEGLVIGAGASYRVNPSLTVRGRAGWAFGRERPQALLELSAGTAGFTRIRGYVDDMRDIGPVPGASGAFNTMAAVTLERDYLDPWFASGVRVSHLVGASGPVDLELSGSWERHRSGRNVVTDPGVEPDFRPVRPVDEGDLWTAAVGALLSAPLPGARVEAAFGRLEGRSFGTVEVGGSLSREWLARGARLDVGLDAGAVTSEAPLQVLHLLGGRGTLPGHPYRRLVGELWWLLRGEISREVMAPWLTLRGSAAVGGTRLGDRELPPAWRPAIDGVRGSVGIGAGLLWDVLRLDLARGIGPSGEWQLVFAVDRRFWPWL